MSLPQPYFKGKKTPDFYIYLNNHLNNVGKEKRTCILVVLANLIKTVCSRMSKGSFRSVWGLGDLICPSSYSACHHLELPHCTSVLPSPQSVRPHFLVCSCPLPAVYHNLLNVVLQRILYICKSKRSVETAAKLEKSCYHPAMNRALGPCLLAAARERMWVWLNLWHQADLHSCLSSARFQLCDLGQPSVSSSVR